MNLIETFNTHKGRQINHITRLIEVVNGQVGAIIWYYGVLDSSTVVDNRHMSSRVDHVVDARLRLIHSRIGRSKNEIRFIRETSRRFRHSNSGTNGGMSNRITS